MSINLIIIIAAIVTFFWRGIGVVCGGRITADSPAFRFAACVAYAVVGALILKLIIYPQGAVAAASFHARLAAVAVALAIYYATRKNVILGAWLGAAALWGMNQLAVTG